MDSPSDEREVIVEEDFHISNSGITVQLIDDPKTGPTLKFIFWVFGSSSMEFEFSTSESDIIETCENIRSAILNKEFNEPHVNHAYRIDENGDAVNQTDSIPLNRQKGGEEEIRDFLSGDE